MSNRSKDAPYSVARVYRTSVYFGSLYYDDLDMAQRVARELRDLIAANSSLFADGEGYPKVVVLGCPKSYTDPAGFPGAR